MAAPSDRNQFIQRFYRCFFAATEAIHGEFMLLPIAGGRRSIFRERVYCYELYHQLRVQMGDDFGYRVGGEVDKGGHPLMNAPGIRNSKPDLLVHQPGDMNGNLIVVEVKPVSVTHRTSIRKDLRTLTAFVRKGRYDEALYLVYGDSGTRLARIITEAHELQRERSELPIELDIIKLFWHRAPGEPAKHIPWTVAGKVNSVV